jgi:hypothetical protein
VLHVLLLVGLRHPAEEVVRRAGSLELEALTVSLRSPEGRGEPLRGLYLPVVETLRLLHDQALARSVFGVRDDSPFQPHLSLLYGVLEPAERARCAEEVAGRCPGAVRLDTLEVMRTSGPVSEWQRLGTFALDRPPAGQESGEA